MSASTIAAEYAKALFALACELDIRDALAEELLAIDGVIRANRQVQIFLESPAIPRDAKRRVIDAAIAPHADALTLRFLQLLVHRGREAFLGRILSAYADLVDRAEGREEVHVASAVPLSAETEDRLAAGLSRTAARTVRLDVSVDPALIGGLTVRVGDRLLDASLRTRLRRLRSRALEV